MKLIKLLILDNDSEYSKILGKTLANRYPSFHIEIIDPKDSNNENTVRNIEDSKYDLILLDESIMLNSLSKGGILYLTESKYKSQTEERFLYKYMGANEISSEIQLLYAEESGLKRLDYSNKETLIIGFTSAMGGVGKSAIAITTARELADFHNFNVLYLSLEEIESNAVYINRDNGRVTLSDYIYYLYSHNESHIATYIDSFIYKDKYGLESFRSSKGMNELAMFSQEKISYFLESICKYRSYDYICIDFNASVSVNYFYYFDICRKIIFIDDSSSLSIYKNNKFLNFINHYYKKDFSEKVIHVRNKWIANPENLPSSEIFVLENDEASFIDRDGYIDIILSNGFGMGVNKLAKEIRRNV